MTQPILGASACVWRNGKVLLIKRGKHPGKGLWSLPGGKIEIGETAERASVRELYEETQIVAELAHPIGPFEVWHDGILIYKVTCFAGHYVSGQAVAGSDAADLAWVYPQALEAFELAPNIAQAIAESVKVLQL